MSTTSSAGNARCRSSGWTSFLERPQLCQAVDSGPCRARDTSISAKTRPARTRRTRVPLGTAGQRLQGAYPVVVRHDDLGPAPERLDRMAVCATEPPVTASVYGAPISGPLAPGAVVTLSAPDIGCQLGYVQIQQPGVSWGASGNLWRVGILHWLSGEVQFVLPDGKTNTEAGLWNGTASVTVHATSGTVSQPVQFDIAGRRHPRRGLHDCLMAL